MPFSHWTSYVHSLWPFISLCLCFGGAVHTVIVEKSEQNSMNTWYKVTWFDVYCYYSGSVDHREVFSILPDKTHLSNHLFSLWAKTVWVKALIILHRMSKYIFLIALNNCYNEQSFRKTLPKSIRSTVQRFHCRGGSIFSEGGVIILKYKIY